MAKFEKSLTGNFDDFIQQLHQDITQGSVSASYEDGSDVRVGEVRMAVRVYERYSMIGGNRVSLNVTVLGNQDQLHIIAITSGGSQAMFFKINTLGESAFLDQCIQSVDHFMARSARM